MPNEEPMVVAQGDLGRLRELQRLLARHGIEAQIAAPPTAGKT